VKVFELIITAEQLKFTVVQKVNQGERTNRAVYPCLAADRVRSWNAKHSRTP